MFRCMSEGYARCKPKKQCLTPARHEEGLPKARRLQEGADWRAEFRSITVITSELAEKYAAISGSVEGESPCGSAVR